MLCLTVLSHRSLPKSVESSFRPPTSWDETKLLNGYPRVSGIARRKGDSVFDSEWHRCTLTLIRSSRTREQKVITFIKDGNEERSFTIDEELDLSNISTTLNVSC